MNLFISYSHKDARWLARLRVHLKPVEGRGNIELWDDTMIRPGDDWAQQVDAALRRADIAIMLVSADFLGSEFITSHELPALLQRARQRSCRVISVIVGPCLFSDIHDLQQFQAVNSPGRPLSKLRRADAEQCLVELAKAILHPALTATDGAAAAPRGAGVIFERNREVEEIIRDVKLGDWDRAAEAALEVIEHTEADGQNLLFRALLNYQDLHSEDPLLWSALHAIECCARLAPWLIERRDLARMAAHSDFSVRSSAASIMMDFAHSWPALVPIDLAIKLSAHDEDWYVEVPANAALKALVRTCPDVLAIYDKRLRSSVSEERLHAAQALREISKNEPQLLDPGRLQAAIKALRRLKHTEATRLISSALAASKRVPRHEFYRYAF